VTRGQFVAAVAAFVLGTVASGCTESNNAVDTEVGGITISAAPSTTSASTAPSSTTPSSTTTIAIVQRRPFEVTHVERTYVRTDDQGLQRTLLTEVWSPAGDGPFPVIAFAHGMDGHPNKFHELFGAWAAAGYVVVAPRFPASAGDANVDFVGSMADSPQQPFDLDFALTAALAESDGNDSEFAGRLDPGNVAVAGLSLGGGTALVASYGDCCPTLRPRLVMAFSPVPFATTQAPGAPPLLLIHGRSDFTLPYQGTADYFATATAQRWFVTLENGAHSFAYEDTPSEHDAVVRDTTIAFLDTFLLGDADGLARAEAAVAASGNASIQSAAATP